MIHPTDPDPHARGVRDGQQVPVTCATCGCRLQGSTIAGETTWRHFSPMAGRDARGCRIACADAPHDVQGLPLVYLAA